MESLMDQPSSAPAFVGLCDGAKLRVSPSGFKNYVRRGLLPQPKKLGTRSLWDVPELLAAVRRQDTQKSGGAHGKTE